MSSSVLHIDTRSHIHRTGPLRTKITKCSLPGQQLEMQDTDGKPSGTRSGIDSQGEGQRSLKTSRYRYTVTTNFPPRKTRVYNLESLYLPSWRKLEKPELHNTNNSACTRPVPPKRPTSAYPIPHGGLVGPPSEARRKSRTLDALLLDSEATASEKREERRREKYEAKNLTIQRKRTIARLKEKSKPSKSLPRASSPSIRGRKGVIVRCNFLLLLPSPPVSK
jgi:hypothetical protein